MAVLDTNILVSLLKGESDAIEKIRSFEVKGENQLSTTIVTAYELLKGAYLSGRSEENIAQVKDTISSLQILGLSVGACEEASKIYRELKEKGRLIGEFDILIASIVKLFDDELVTRDVHFKSVKGLKTVEW